MSEIDDIVSREGGLVNNPADKGGITKYGITKGTLSWFRNVPVTDDDIINLSLREAQDIYEARYVKGPGFDKLPNSVLQSNMIDFGVMSGPQLAIQNLQNILHIEADGIIGPKTIQAVEASNLVALNAAIVKSRILMCARICKRDPSQLVFLVGWLNRIFSFLGVN